MAHGAQAIEAPWQADAIRALFDPATGWLDRRVRSDEALYQRELERIFARAWTEWMVAWDWADLKRNHSPAPEGRI